jgi:2-polyprenyl-3-methyl-5-hydroxy-6-metoxy-1,4-benzoquinol methylase
MSRSDTERDFFDKVAEKRLQKSPCQEAINVNEFERYRLTKNAAYFGKEKMFSLVNQHEGKRILEVGCGEGESSVRLAYVGKEVTAFDISPKSIERAKRIAEVNDLKVDFRVGDVTKDETIGNEKFDIVWFELVLHHLVPELEEVMSMAYNALKPGGLFVSWEPIAYARWIRKFDPVVKILGGRLPKAEDFTPDECPLRPSEFEIIRRYFPDLQMKHYDLLRGGRFTRNLKILKFIRQIDNCLLAIPGMKKLVGGAVMWAYK